MAHARLAGPRPLAVKSCGLVSPADTLQEQSLSAVKIDVGVQLREEMCYAGIVLDLDPEVEEAALGRSQSHAHIYEFLRITVRPETNQRIIANVFDH